MPTKIQIAGEDRTDELLPALEAAASARVDRLHAKRRMPEQTALGLREARSEAEFLERFLEHLRRQHGRFSEGYEPVPRKGLSGRVRGAVQGLIARLLRFHQDPVQARQGLLNELLLSAMEFQQDAHRHDLERLADRVRALESRHDAMPRPEDAP